MRACLCLLLFSAIAAPLPAQITAPAPLGPDDVWIVINKNMPASLALGEFYCQQAARCLTIISLNSICPKAKR